MLIGAPMLTQCRALRLHHLEAIASQAAALRNQHAHAPMAPGASPGPAAQIAMDKPADRTQDTMGETPGSTDERGHDGRAPFGTRPP